MNWHKQKYSKLLDAEVDKDIFNLIEWMNKQSVHTFYSCQGFPDAQKYGFNEKIIPGYILFKYTPQSFSFVSYLVENSLGVDWRSDEFGNPMHINFYETQGYRSCIDIPVDHHRDLLNHWKELASIYASKSF